MLDHVNAATAMRGSSESKLLNILDCIYVNWCITMVEYDSDLMITDAYNLSIANQASNAMNNINQPTFRTAIKNMIMYMKRLEYTNPTVFTAWNNAFIKFLGNSPAYRKYVSKLKDPELLSAYIPEFLTNEKLWTSQVTDGIIKYTPTSDDNTEGSAYIHFEAGKFASVEGILKTFVAELNVLLLKEGYARVTIKSSPTLNDAVVMWGNWLVIKMMAFFPYVQEIWLNKVLFAQTGSTPVYTNNLTLDNLKKHWNLSKAKANAKGKDVVVAVCDSGVYHNASFKNKIVGGYNAISQSLGVTEASDDMKASIAHGTGVASVITSLSDAKIYAVKVLNSQGMATTYSLDRGIAHIIAKKDVIDIANFSLGVGRSSCRASCTLCQLMTELKLVGVIPVASAGNHPTSAVDVSCCQNFLVPPSSSCRDMHLHPVKCPSKNAISVGALGPTKQQSCFSMYGGLQAQKPILSTFGVRIRVESNNGTYHNLSGTSFSGPIISAMIAREHEYRNGNIGNVGVAGSIVDDLSKSVIEGTQSSYIGGVYYPFPILGTTETDDPDPLDPDEKEKQGTVTPIEFGVEAEDAEIDWTTVGIIGGVGLGALALGAYALTRRRE